MDFSQQFSHQERGDESESQVRVSNDDFYV